MPIRSLMALLLLLFLAPVALADLPPGTTTTRDLQYATQNNKPLLLDLYLPPPPPQQPNTAPHPLPVILRLAPKRETPEHPAEQLLAQGYALLYVGYLPHDADKFTAFCRFPADLHAAQAALTFIVANSAKFHLDPDRIGLWAAGHGATIAALLAVTADQQELYGRLGDAPYAGTPVRTVCLLGSGGWGGGGGGTTDWRNAELYGDETVNNPDSPAYQLFGDNPKALPDTARLASAINYVRPTSPPVLMITLQSDAHRAMHLIFAETLRRAGVASALYEESAGAGLGGRNVDEAKLDRTILDFFTDTLPPASPPLTVPHKEPLTIDQEIDILSKAGLFKQARRLIEQQLITVPPAQREPYRTKLRQLADQQQEPALRKLLEVRKNKEVRAAQLARFGANSAAVGGQSPHIRWTLREVLTDPERIGQYEVEATLTQADFDARAASARLMEALNALVQQQDWPAADRKLVEIRRQAAAADGTNSAPALDKSLLDTALQRYGELRVNPDRLYPPGSKPVAFASAFGQDLYGFWFDLRAGNTTLRFRYIPAPPGNKFTMGSSKDEWGRLPGEPLLAETPIPAAFWLAETPITQQVWEGVLGTTENHSHFHGPNLPVENVSYAHAVNFAEKLGVEARLPTEAEWEYACRGGPGDPASPSGYMYSGTQRLSDMAWFWDERQDVSPDTIRILHELETESATTPRSTHDIKTKLPNAFGLYNMHGNVWQWCSGTSDKLKDYHPTRGGSWISIPQSCRAARSSWHPTEYQAWNLGLRILIPAK